MDIINNFLNGLSTPETIVTLIAGLAILVFGYRIKKAAFFIIWFLIGYMLVNRFILSLVAGYLPDVISIDLYNLILPLAGGLLLALLGFSIEKVCVGGICFALTLLITATYFGTEMQTLAIGAIIGVIASGLGVMMMKPATIIATALAGAYAIAISSLKLSGIDASIYFFPILIGSAIIGSIIQFLTTRNTR